MALKLTRLTHKITIELHLVAGNCTIFSPRSRRPVRKLFDTLSRFPRCDRLCLRPLNVTLMWCSWAPGYSASARHKFIAQTPSHGCQSCHHIQSYHMSLGCSVIRDDYLCHRFPKSYVMASPPHRTIILFRSNSGSLFTSNTAPMITNFIERNP